MAREVVMPKLGLTMTEGKIIKWYAQEGDAITKNQKLFDVETDKLTNTIEASAEGVLLKILYGEGSTVPCLEPIAYVGQAGEEVEIKAPAAATSEEAAVDDSPVIAHEKESTKTRVIASPRAKALAKELGVDIHEVEKSGEAVRIRAQDVIKYHETAKVKPKATPLAAKIAAEEGLSLDKLSSLGRIYAEDLEALRQHPELEEVMEMNNMREVIASRMRQSVDISANVNYTISVDVSELKFLKDKFQEAEVYPTYTDLLIKLVSVALLEHPLLNASVVEGNQILLRRFVNMGMAVALDDGLIVPNIKDAHGKNVKTISEETKNLVAKAKGGRLEMEEITGGTFTITNIGMFDIEGFTPIINQPEVAILGVNTIKDEMVIIDKEPVIKPMMKLSLTADHRVVDGAVAAKFLQHLKTLIEKPYLAI